MNIPWDTVDRELRGCINHFHRMSEMPDVTNDRALGYIHAAQEVNERLQRLLCTMIDTNVQEGSTEHSHGGHGTDAGTEAKYVEPSWCGSVPPDDSLAADDRVWFFMPNIVNAAIKSTAGEVRRCWVPGVHYWKQYVGQPAEPLPGASTEADCDVRPSSTLKDWINPPEEFCKEDTSTEADA